MELPVLLEELRAIAENVPDFSQFTPTSRIHQEWLGKAHALVQQWDRNEASFLTMQEGFVSIPLSCDSAIANIVSILQRTIADLELRLSVQPDRVFGPGAVYDFFKALREVLASATQSILIVDPYLDDQVFDCYLTAVSPNVVVRLLARKSAAALTWAVAKFVEQTHMAVEARSSNDIHDRVVFLDDRSCWVLGQSIKDAAKSRPTYLAPLDSNTARLKKEVYENIWVSAKPI